MRKWVALFTIVLVGMFISPGNVAKADWYTTDTYACSANAGLAWLQGNAETKTLNIYSPPNGNYRLFEGVVRHWPSIHGNTYSQDWKSTSSHAFLVNSSTVRVQGDASVTQMLCVPGGIACVDIWTDNISCNKDHNP